MPAYVYAGNRNQKGDISMKRKFGLSAAVIAIYLIASLPLAVCATVKSYEIDNDPRESTGYDHINNGFSYRTSGNNGDSRIASTGSGYSYCWTHPAVTFGTMQNYTITLQVYLNDSSFTDPKAEYRSYTQLGNTAVNTLIGTYNQDTAPAGFSTVKTVSASAVELRGIRVNTGGTYGYNTGADTVKFSYYY